MVNPYETGKEISTSTRNDKGQLWAFATVGVTSLVLCVIIGAIIGAITGWVFGHGDFQVLGTISMAIVGAGIGLVLGIICVIVGALIHTRRGLRRGQSRGR
jgi:hypothetical protein